jgi:hypothetical protein
MNSNISENTKRTVIRLWVEGNSRNDIALITGVSEGTVSNIIAEWSQKRGDGDADAIRELGINMKRLGIDAVKCAEGLRISSTMKKLGVNRNQLKSFINEVYQYCQRFGLTPLDIASNLQALITLSKDVPFSRIPDHIEEKKKEISRLEAEIRKRHEDIKTLEETKETLELETSVAKDLHDVALQDEKIISAKLRKCWNLLEELEKHGLDIYDEDISKFVKLIKNLREYYFNVKEVISEFQDLQSLKLQLEYLPKRLNELVKHKLMLEQDCAILENRIRVHYQKLSLIDELRSMGLGLNYLKILCNTIREIASENGKSYRIAMEQFFGWVEKLYGAIRLRQKIQEHEQAEYAIPDNNLTATYPYYSDIKPFTTLPEPSALEEQKPERQRKLRSSIFYSYKKINTKSKTTKQEEEKSNQSDDDDNHDGDIYDG